VKPVFYSPRSSMFVLPYFVLSLTVLVGLIPRATIAGGVAVCLTSTWIFSSIEVMGTQQKDNITERFDSAFFGSEVDLSITSHVDTQAFYAYNLPPEARLLKREKLEKHLPDFDRRFAHVAVFAVRDRRRPFSNWPEDPVMERLLSASTQTERIVQTPGTNVYLLRVSLAEWERRSP